MPPGTRSSRSAGAESRTSTPRSAQPGGQRADERRHAPVERPEERRPVGVGSGHLGAQRPHEAAPALGGRQQRRERRRGGHVVDRAGVDAADERIDQRVDDTPAELVRHEGADGTVADRPAGVGPGQHGVAGEAERAARAEDAGAGRGPEPGRDPERVPLGQVRRRPRDHTDAPRAAIGTSASASPTSRHRSTASRRRPRKPSGPTSTTRPPNSSLCSGPPRRDEASSTVTVGAPGRRPAPPVSSQAAVRPLMPPPTTTTRRAVTSGRPVRPDDQIGQRGNEERGRH